MRAEEEARGVALDLRGEALEVLNELARLLREAHELREADLRRSARMSSQRPAPPTAADLLPTAIWRSALDGSGARVVARSEDFIVQITEHDVADLRWRHA